MTWFLRFWILLGFMCKLKSLRSLRLSFSDDNRELLLEWRGAGTAAYFYQGIWNAFSLLDPDGLWRKNFRFRGISSGSLMAALAVCRLDLKEVVEKFDLAVQQEHARIEQLFWPQKIYYRPWMDARIRCALVPAFLKTTITNEMVTKYCTPGKLKVVALNLLNLRVVEKDTWKNVDELILWISAGMSIPGVTSWAGRWVENPSNQHNMLLVDAMSFPKRTFPEKPDQKQITTQPGAKIGDQVGQVLRARRVCPHSISFSPLAIERSYVDVYPTHSLPSLLSLCRLPPPVMEYLRQQGELAVLKFLTKFCQHP